MFWFFTALGINSLALLLIIANAVYDALTLKNSSGHNDFVNLIGVVLAVVIVFAFSLKNAGKQSIANMVLWIPGAPLALFFFFTAIYFVIIFLTDSDWK
ncbi:hypothetical protein [Dyadobacter luticola]|uniref:Uncharacterized protein n=1 Tax=Dyadobacter luticola TaxID=1979387 RepID=A0A5R9L472_9BACT|nr:hypothetical protein [Dyadobacter luticola]TLV03366.1 hypothetical protein FEN17_07085 [Dyadobacter luticola]